MNETPNISTASAPGGHGDAESGMSLGPAPPGVRRPKPLLPLAIGLAVGINLDHVMKPTLPVGAVIGLIGITIAILPSRWLRIGIPRLRVRRMTLGIVLIAVALGLLRHGIADRGFRNDDIARWLMDEPVIVTLTGRIAAPPRIIEARADVPRAYDSPPRTRSLVETEALLGDAGTIPVTGRVLFTVKEPMLKLRDGSRIRVTGWLSRIRPPQNPGAYDWAAHYHRQGIHAAFSTDHAQAVTILESTPTGRFARFVQWARGRLKGYVVDRAFPDDEEAAGIVNAMVLGQRSEVPRSINDAFQRTGNLHLLAASGMNVAWLALVGWGIAFLCGLSYRPTALLIGALIIAFVVVAEPQPSILRAGIVGLLTCATLYFRRKASHANALSLAAIILLMMDPNDWFRPGFQFTFLATLGLLHFCPLVSAAIAARFGGARFRGFGQLFQLPMNAAEAGLAPIAAATSILKPLRRVGNLMALSFALALSEWIITMPLAAYLFNVLTPWGALCGFITAPLAMVSATFGFVMVIGGMILPTMGLLMGPALALSTRVLLFVVQYLAALPGALLNGRSPSLAWLLATYALIGFWAYGPPEGRLRHRRVYSLAAMLLIVWWWFGPMFMRHSGDLRVWMLAIGDGTATVIELPNKKTILFDFGTRSAFDAGIVGIDFLRHRGITQIDAAFVSHPNFDHFGGLETLAARVPIRRLFINDQFEPLAPAKSASAYFLKSMRAMGIPIETLHGYTPFEFCPYVTIESLWPPPRAERPFATDNDTSTVLRIEYQGRSILLTGDIADPALGGLLAGIPGSDAPAPFPDSNRAEHPLHADALALPHHGSVVTNTRAFIHAVDPMFAIRSSGQRRGLTTNGIEQIVGPTRTYFNTADDGCIVITIRDGALTVLPAMSGSSRPSVSENPPRNSH